MDCTKDSVLKYTFDFESDIINIQDYFSDYAKLLPTVEKCEDEKYKTFKSNGCGTKTCKNDNFYRAFLDISQEELDELKERTSVDHLTCDGEIEPVSHEFYKKFNENSLKPKITSNEDSGKTKSDLVSVAKRSELEVSQSEFPRHFFKYCNYQWCAPLGKVKGISELDLFENSTIIACVKVYYPFLSSKTKVFKAKLLQEIHILGDQTLSDLKDKIICSIDYADGRDASSECFLKEVGLQITDKDKYPSSFIFIEDVFYNDTRSPKLVDLSKELREWASKRNIGPFDAKSMENIKICDLALKIGRPYVYQHQGNCEHILMFSDIRFLNNSDPHKLSSYPKVHSIGRIYGKHCMMCSDLYAKWLVVNNLRLTHDKAYLCQKCFVSYNYINGQKVGEFQAYKYVDPVALL